MHMTHKTMLYISYNAWFEITWFRIVLAKFSFVVYQNQ